MVWELGVGEEFDGDNSTYVDYGNENAHPHDHCHDDYGHDDNDLDNDSKYK